MEDHKALCPMSFSNTQGPSTCCEKQCRWWRTYYKNTEMEHGECGIMSIMCLQDMVG